MLNLSFHGHKKEHQPIHDQDWPEHWNIKNGEECRKKSHHHRPNTRIPELELWQSPHKWSKFIIRLGWQSWPIIPRGFQWCQESQQQVQVEYCHGIGHNIKSFQVEYSGTIYHQEHSPSNPSVQRSWGTLVQKHLIRSLHPMQPLLYHSRLILVAIMVLLPHLMPIYMCIPIHWSYTRTTTACPLSGRPYEACNHKPRHHRLYELNNTKRVSICNVRSMSTEQLQAQWRFLSRTSSLCD